MPPPRRNLVVTILKMAECTVVERAGDALNETALATVVFSNHVTLKIARWPDFSVDRQTTDRTNCLTPLHTRWVKKKQE